MQIIYLKKNKWIKWKYIKKNLKQNEEKEELLNKNIKTLERDNSKLEQEIKNNESLFDTGLDNRKEQLENKILELENTL